MIVGGIGVPELVWVLLLWIVPVAIIIVIAYFVIRNAVAAGILRADELRKNPSGMPKAPKAAEHTARADDFIDAV